MNYDKYIQAETDLIAKLKANPVKPNYYKRKDGTNYPYPKGEYATYLTKIKDAYWRRRMLIAKRDNLEPPASIG